MHLPAFALGSERLPPTRPPGAPSAAAELARAHRLLAEAEQGSREAAEAAIARLRALVEADPADTRARALLGVAHVLRARDVPLAAKLPAVREGFLELDRAVASDPDDVENRLLRAINSSQMPGLLGRREVAVEDFAWLLAQAEHPDTLSPSQQRRVLFHAGSFALREGRSAAAAKFLKRALATDSTEPADDVIESALALARRPSNPPTHADEKENSDQETSAP